MSNNDHGNKFPYLVGIGMILGGVVMMILSGQMSDSTRSVLIFVGVLIFIGGFAATVIYSTRKPDEYDENGNKKQRPRSEKIMWAWGLVCLIGLLAMVAGFALFGEINYLVVFIGMAVFLIGGSSMISVFTKHSSEFVKKNGDQQSDNENKDDKTK